ncbi:MAG: hypothetical protein ACQETZ_01590 [Candidatus Fermentibacterota bacterium]
MIELSGRLLRTLRREAGSDPAGFRLLCSEAVARRWLAGRGVPSWRSAQPPAAEGRYGLLLPRWRRAMVWSSDEKPPGFDRMAAAKCELGIAVGLARGGSSGEVAGWLELADVPRMPPHLEPGGPPPLRHPDRLAPRIGRRRHPRLVLAAGLLRILAAGEPQPPPPPQ